MEGRKAASDVSRGGVQVEHHDRDDYGDNAVAKSFEPSFAHVWF
jgi:hypothetical protein